MLTISLVTALRLYPQPTVNMRVANKTTLLPSGGGPSGTSPVLIPKGTAVGYSIYHMHHMAKSLWKKCAWISSER